jgi:hypothetical protein
MTEETGFPPEPDLPLPQRTPGEALARAQSGTGDETGAEVFISPVPPTRPRYRFAGIDVPVAEWTVDPETNRSNASPEYLHLVDEVAHVIRESAYFLLDGRPGGVRKIAGLIMAQLAHVHGLAPAGSTSELEGERARVGALLGQIQSIPAKIRAQKQECPEPSHNFLAKPSCWYCGRNGAFERAAKIAEGNWP